MAASDINVDDNTLRIIGQALTRLHLSNDPVSAEKLWTLGDQADVSKLSFHDVDSLDSALNNIRSVFRQLEATKNALFLLARSCEQRLSVLKVEARPYFLHSGILSLPDDVLALIFENSLLGRYEYARISPEYSISHVCRRFRSISLGLPKLWSHVTSYMSKKWVEIRLLRSKTAGLAVDIYGDDEPRNDRIARFASQVVPLAHRWQSFMLFARDRSASYNPRVTQQFANLKLPALTYLDIELDEFTDSDSDFDDLEFYGSWEMPKLRHSNIEHRIPTDAMYGSKTITSFAFTFSRESLDFNFRKLMDFLSSLDNLTDLSLELVNCDDYDYDADLADRVVLPKVESFTLETRIFKALKVMTTSVHMPALTKLSLDISEGDNFSSRAWLDIICMKKYPSVKDFTFVYRKHQPTYKLYTIFSAFPNMQSLALDTPNTIVCSSFENPSLPPLRSMSLSCTSGNRLMEPLVRVFKRQGMWNDFETLEITDNRLLVRAKKSREG